MTELEFENNFEIHRDDCINWVMFRVHDRGNAEDIVQNAMLKVWMSRHRYKDKGTPRAYLFRILGNEFIDYCRKNKMIPKSEIRDIPSSDNFFCNNIAYKALIHLPMNQFEAVYEVDVCGSTYQQGADVMNMGLNAFKANVYRGRQKLKTILKEYALREYNIK